MKAKKWEILSSETRLDTKIFNVGNRRCRSPISGTVANFVVLDVADWVNIVALTGDDKVVLIKQYRPGTDEVTLEIPGGVCEPGENPVESGRRELTEETGFEARSCRLLGYVRPNPAFMNNKCYTLLATGCEKTSPTNFDNDEEIETLEVPLADFAGLLKSGEIDHSLIWSAYVHLLHAGVIS